MESLKELLNDELRDLYDAEKQLVKALPKFAKAASNEELKQAFEEHLEVTKNHVQRLEQVFEMLGQKAKSKPCAAMKGLLEEGQEILKEEGSESLLDTAMIGAAQKVEHYEISGYGTVRTLAQRIGLEQAAELLEETLEEEKEADEKLTEIAGRVLDGAAVDEEDEEDEEDEDLEEEEEEGEEEDADAAPQKGSSKTPAPAAKKPPVKKAR